MLKEEKENFKKFIGMMWNNELPCDYCLLIPEQKKRCQEYYKHQDNLCADLVLIQLTSDHPTKDIDEYFTNTKCSKNYRLLNKPFFKKCNEFQTWCLGHREHDDDKYQHMIDFLVNEFLPVVETWDAELAIQMDDTLYFGIGVLAYLLDIYHIDINDGSYPSLAKFYTKYQKKIDEFLGKVKEMGPGSGWTWLPL